MRLKIVNPTGRALDSRVVDADTGEQLEGVTDVVLTMDKEEAWLPIAVITVLGVQVDAVLNKVVIQGGGKVTSIDLYDEKERLLE